jgi:hypothetical protein
MIAVPRAEGVGSDILAAADAPEARLIRAASS